DFNAGGRAGRRWARSAGGALAGCFAIRTASENASLTLSTFRIRQWPALAELRRPGVANAIGHHGWDGNVAELQGPRRIVPIRPGEKLQGRGGTRPIARALHDDE